MKKHNYVYTIVRQTPDRNGVRKGYIGVHCTDNLDDGYFGSGRYLTRAVKKYGREDFVKTIVADFETEEEAVAYETELLHRMHRLSGGNWELFSERFYNLKLNNSRGKVSLSESTRKKIGESSSGKIISEETRKKISESLTGKIISEETRKKISESLTGKIISEETRKKMSESKSGKIISEETRKKMSESKSGEKHNQFKGFTIGTSLTDGKIIVFNGEKSMQTRGFYYSIISRVLSGKRTHHKNFTFTRTKDPDFLKNLLDQNNFIDEESKTIIENFLK